MDGKMIVERIEGELALCEQAGESVEIALELLPEGVRPGDVCYETGSGWAIDQEETLTRRKNVARRYRELFGK